MVSRSDNKVSRANFLKACRTGDVETVKKCIQDGMDLNEQAKRARRR